MEHAATVVKVQLIDHLFRDSTKSSQRVTLLVNVLSHARVVELASTVYVSLTSTELRLTTI